MTEVFESWTLNAQMETVWPERPVSALPLFFRSSAVFPFLSISPNSCEFRFDLAFCSCLSDVPACKYRQKGGTTVPLLS